MIRRKPQLLNIHSDDIPPGAVSIMRPGPGGNPFVLGRDGNRDQVCDKFERFFRSNLPLQRWCEETLRGKDLVCCCAPRRCHGQTYLDFLYGKVKKTPWSR